MNTLTKKEVEILLETYDEDPAGSLRIAVSSLLGLILLGGLAARTGGAPIANGAFRVGFWGVLAMVSTSLIGWAFGTVL